MRKSSIYLIIALILTTPINTFAQRHEVRRDGRVLAHSLHFDPTELNEEMPPLLYEMLRGYKTQQRYAPRMTGKRVDPLLRSRRHQEEPFNGSCPYYIYEDSTTSEQRCIVGCVATCIEQVLTYYRHPQCLTDTLHGWKTEHYTIQDILPGTKIEWDDILDDYSNGYTPQQAKAVADLSYYCGVAAHMNWGLGSSGANLGKAFNPLYDAFDYKTIAFAPRWLYTNDTWNRMLRNELENGRPICYTGHNMTLGGHAFNIDGVDEDGFYHLNWGYDGDYDGWFDLDYLNPFEPQNDATELGRNEGFYCNQTAMFMHPDDFVIDIMDTLSAETAYKGVKVDTITFRKSPDTNQYTIADFDMTNTTDDTLHFTFEVLTYLPTDTAIFEQADYVALSGISLLPHEHRIWPVYCQFSEPGERIIAYSADDETLFYQKPINVTKGITSKLSFGEIECQQTLCDNNLKATFTIDITNNAVAGCAGNLITYCLLPSSSDIDLRHWQVLQLPATKTITDSVTFQNLVDGQEYTLMVRCPWPIQKTFTFTADSKQATNGINDIQQNTSVSQQSTLTYDLLGRPTAPQFRGLYIRNGHKIFIP